MCSVKGRAVFYLMEGENEAIESLPLLEASIGGGSVKQPFPFAPDAILGTVAIYGVLYSKRLLSRRRTVLHLVGAPLQLLESGQADGPAAGGLRSFRQAYLLRGVDAGMA